MQWFTATKPGVYHLFCNMYCGGQHSEMGGYVYAMEPKDYANWLANGGMDMKPMTMEQRGALTYERLACGNCHTSVDTLHAPTLYGFFGRNRKFSNGSSVVADEAYFRKSLIDPHEVINEGYTDTMNAYNEVSEEEILNMIAYVKSLGSSSQPAVPKQIPIEAFKGDPNTGSNFEPAPNMAAGALQSEERVMPVPTKGNLAVGALATERGERR
jgi:cytochrome c oxidase subunit 2